MSWDFSIGRKRCGLFWEPYSYCAFGWMNSWHYVPGRVGFHGRFHISLGLRRIGFHVS